MAAAAGGEADAASSVLDVSRWRASDWASAILLIGLLAVPIAAWATGEKFYLDLAVRIVAFAIAAAALNLVLGYGGLISFGHAAFMGIGAYAVGIPAYYDYGSGLLHFPLAVGMAGLFALITGAVCLRTRGVYFIMITMAFAQMAYYLFLSLEEYGGDDGLTIYNRSTLPLIDLERPLVLFLFAYVSLLAVLYLQHRVVNSRFGLALVGAKGNEARMQALGFDTYAYRLTAYVISGAVAGFAGALLANFASFISPEMLSWTRSGELMFMVILGGAGTVLGPVAGAAAILLLEEWLSGLTVYWQLPFGLLLIAIVMVARGGLWGLLTRPEARS